MRAIFLDRDGVINHNRPDHVTRWEEFRFLPHSLRALQQLSGLGWPLIVITNQAIINRGIARSAQVETIHARMMQQVAAAGGRIEAVFYCPHRPDESCGCRKPRPGMLHRAADQYSLSLRRSYLIGDAVSDIEAGYEAGCECILVLSGRGREQLQQRGRKRLPPGCHILPHIGAAARWILMSEQRTRLYEARESPPAVPLSTQAGS